MNIQIVAAAIATATDRVMEERRIKTSDADGMAEAVQDVETMVANQLVREGMAMKDALALAGRAALHHAPASDESNALAEAARLNEHSDVPEPANDVADAAASPAGPASAAADGATADATTGTDDVDASIPVETPARKPVAVRAPAPAAAVATVLRAQAPERPKIGYRVEMKKVSDLFKGIDPKEELFQFDVPFIHWDRPHPGVPAIDTAYNMGFSDLLAMLYAIVAKRTVNLVGPHGCGKTQFVAQVAARLRFPLTVLPMDGQLSRSEMIGRERIRATSHGNESYFSPGLLPLSLEEPGFVLFDEVDRGVSDIQYACHSVYLQEGIKIMEDGGRTIPMHEYNRVYTTANTKGRGSADGMYLAAEDMSEATRDRLSIWIEMTYQTPDEDAAVLRAKTPNLSANTAKTIAEVAEQIRNAFDEQRLSQTCSLRQQLEVAGYATFLSGMMRDASKQDKLLGMAFNRIILGRASPEDKGAITTMIESKVPNAFAGDPIL